MAGMLEAARAGQPLFSGLADLVPSAGIFFIGLLLLPSTFFALRRVLGRASPPFIIPGRPLGLVILFLPAPAARRPRGGGGGSGLAAAKPPLHSQGAAE